ncbi:cysteine desulfurase [Oscillospiraceae bacterium HV4-5-C5C]|nr:cysteine desulfurase [Oscillospiraceae bacterium HV4-5-C5C]
MRLFSQTFSINDAEQGSGQPAGRAAPAGSLTFREVYADYAAGTPLLPAARQALLTWLDALPGNPSSVHRRGRLARRGLNEARRELASCLGADASELYFTSGGTEALNWAARALAAHGRQSRKPLILCSAVEHQALRRPLEALADEGGCRLQLLPADRYGCLDLAAAANGLDDPETGAVCLMLVNNETGVIQPAGRLAALCRERGILFLGDAMQAAGKLALDLRRLEADYLVLGAHKFGGPVGTGVLYARQGSPLPPLLYGGPQEAARRAGTENVAMAAAMAAALRTRTDELVETEARLSLLDQRFCDGLRQLDGCRLLVPRQLRLPGYISVLLPRFDAETWLILLDRAGIEASAGSACAAGALEASPVYLAMGLPPEKARHVVRFSFGWTTTAEDIDYCLQVIGRTLAKAASRKDEL